MAQDNDRLPPSSSAPRLNVLLLLSYDQMPPPDEEVLTLSDECRKKGEVYFATTRHLGSLEPGSQVSFHGDSQDEGRLLAVAEFIEFIPLESGKADRILEDHVLYGAQQPSRMRGFIRLKKFRLASANDSLAGLGGYLHDGRSLDADGISYGYQGASLYYVVLKGDGVVPAESTVRLLEAKVRELEDKYAFTREAWARDQERLLESFQHQAAEIRNFQGRVEPAGEERSRKVSGRTRQLRTLAESLFNTTFPDVEFLRDSIEQILFEYAGSRTLMRNLLTLNDNPRLSRLLPGGKSLQGAKGWQRARFGDNLGRLYYRTIGRGSDVKVQCLVSRKTSQPRDVAYLTKL